MPKIRTKRFNAKAVVLDVNKEPIPVHSFVFAHVRGYKPWPAQIVKHVTEKRFFTYEVFFFGTYQT